MEEKVQISIWATPAEVEALERIMRHFCRTTRADAVRYLILAADKKILPSLTATADKPEETERCLAK
ncbi:MAG: hypothetical protein MJ016_02280 [Victivallaceae bacterium]|nr:hypothetical protein [Victivallaceae bacterium]